MEKQESCTTWRFTAVETGRLARQANGGRTLCLHKVDSLMTTLTQASHLRALVNSSNEESKNRSDVALSKTAEPRNTKLRETKCCPTWPKMQP